MMVLGQSIVAGRCSTFVDFGSILKFIETNFKLPSLGYADDPADDLAGCYQPSRFANSSLRAESGTRNA
jgi:hypothetical protein